MLEHLCSFSFMVISFKYCPRQAGITILKHSYSEMLQDVTYTWSKSILTYGVSPILCVLSHYINTLNLLLSKHA